MLLENPIIEAEASPETVSKETEIREDSSAPVADEELVARIVAGDQKAYSLLVQRYLNKIWRLAMSILQDEQEAEDAAQDVFLTLWQSLEKWDPDGQAKFSTWIYRVSFNKCIDIKRKRKPTTNTDDLVMPSGEESAYETTLQHELSDQMMGLLGDLPDMQSTVLRLYYYEELSVEEISGRLDKTEQSVRSLLKRGKATLKEKMAYHPDLQPKESLRRTDHLWR